MIRLVQNPLHPESAFVDEDAVVVGDDLDELGVPDGYERVRLILPEGSELRPQNWQVVRRSAVFELPPHNELCPNAVLVKPADWAAWFEAHWEYYRDCHSDNPPARPVDLRRAFGDAIEDGTAVFIGSGFASLRGMTAGVSEAGWIGGNKSEVEEGVRWCRAKAHEIGAKSVRFDADDTDPFLWSALHKLANPIEVFETFELS